LIKYSCSEVDSRTAYNLGKQCSQHNAQKRGPAIRQCTHAQSGNIQLQTVSPKLLVDAFSKSTPAFPKDTILSFEMSQGSVRYIMLVVFKSTLKTTGCVK
jgi:hypothetical protein